MKPVYKIVLDVSGCILGQSWLTDGKPHGTLVAIIGKQTALVQIRLTEPPLRCCEHRSVAQDLTVMTRSLTVGIAQRERERDRERERGTR